MSVYSQHPTLLYIDKYSDLAISEMKIYNIPASITLAQGILESGNGTSRLAVDANNHFGIKCHGWEGKEIYADDDEENECFRKYNDVKESYRDHSSFLIKNKRYSFLFDLDITDYKSWSKGLQKAGYATSKTYSDKLISIIDRYSLYKFDKSLEASGRKIFMTQSYGFPFVYAVGINYFNTDEYFFHFDLKSSFFYSALESGFRKHLSNGFYSGASIIGMYNGDNIPFTYESDLSSSDVDFGVALHLTYVLDLDKRRLLVDVGGVITLDQISQNELLDLGFFPMITFTYLMK